MSSRRGGFKAKGGANKFNMNDAADKKIPVHQAPPNHPQENFPEHRTFLARSLNRNDADLAAVVDLNRSLHQVRANIIKACGEEILLDLGEGSFLLTPCGGDLMLAPALAEDKFDSEEAYNSYRQSRAELQERSASLEDDHALLCVDFLSRMKLRRRLLNRLARRLMRVAHAMDGEDVSPPIPPKYGDLKLNVDQGALDNAKRVWKYQEEARQRVAAYRLENPSSLLPLVGVEEDAADEVKEEDKMDVDEQDEESKVDAEEETKSEMDTDKVEEKEEASEESDQKIEQEGFKGEGSLSEENEIFDLEKSKEEETNDETKVLTDGDKTSAKEVEDHVQEEDVAAKAYNEEAAGSSDVAMGAVMQENDGPDAAVEPILQAKKNEAEKDKAGATEERVVAAHVQMSPTVRGESLDAKEKTSHGDANMGLQEPNTQPQQTDETTDNKIEEEIETAEASVADVTTYGDTNMEGATSDQSLEKAETGKDLDVEMQDADKHEVEKSGKEDVIGNGDETGPTAETKPTCVNKAALDEAAAETLSPELPEPVDNSDDEKLRGTPADNPSEATENIMSDTTPTMNEAGLPEEGHQMTAKSNDDEKPWEQSNDKSKLQTDCAEASRSDAALKAKVDSTVSEPVQAKHETDEATEDDSPKGMEKREVGSGDEDKPSVTISANGEEDQPPVAISVNTETSISSVVGAAHDDWQGRPREDKHAVSGPAPDGTVSTPVKAKKEENRDTEGSACDGTPSESPRKPVFFELPPPRELSQLEKDIEILKDYVDAYEKQIDPRTGDVSFRILKDQDREEDYVAINRGVGVGASSRSMSINEKEVEYKRWQTSLLSTLPEAPTFEEIGMKNCVFLLEERRKRLRLERDNEKGGSKKPKFASPVKNGGDNDGEAPKSRNIGAVERKSPAKKSRDEEDKQMDEKLVKKRIKPIPLVSYPSFFESDLRRIRLVHFDLMATSIQSGAKNRLDAAQNDYNNGKFLLVDMTCLRCILYVLLPSLEIHSRLILDQRLNTQTSCLTVSKSWRVN
jgi:hypothetical protein